MEISHCTCSLANKNDELVNDDSVSQHTNALI